MLSIIPNITSSDWVSVNSLAGVAVGEKMTLVNQGSTPLLLLESETKPDISTNDGKVLQDSGNPDLSKTTVMSSSKEIWVKSSSTVNGRLYVQTLYPFNDSDNGVDPRVYTGYQGFTTQPFTEANVKNGTQYAFAYEFESIPSGDTVYLALTTPNTTDDTLIKTRIISTNGGMRYRPYGGATFTTNGVVPVENLNKRSSNTTGVVINTVDPLSVDLTGAVSFDVVRSTEGVGSNRQQGIFEGTGIERVLQRNTSYLLEFENLDTKAIYVVITVTWYSGPLSDDIV